MKESRSYLAVLGLVLEAFNLLGATETDEGTRERADEAIEGEISGPMDTSRGEAYADLSPREVGRRTEHLLQPTVDEDGGAR